MEDYIITVGKRIKQIRKDKKLTINDIAQRADVSNGLISRVENGRTIPSLPVLFSLISALETDIALFFKDLPVQSKNPFLVFRKEEMTLIEKEENAEGFIYQHIFSKQFPFVGFECVLLEVHPNSKREHVVTDAFEFKFIISGECTYIIGEEEVLLKQGDSIFFDGRIPHVPVNRGDLSSTMLVVYFYINPE
ncbi:DNA-binding protein [Elizabethkingia sp. HvH-WGS333]|uniref:helix-turn-helix domain-containing protein n=1 Tax=Elizabethkingia TaxID=308865 RepID=UPI00074159B1|nr:MULTISPECIES: XRE family transcriptional regulator [Elizabethkingia]KUG11108.1 DNA-binding protein [Elizabethkingia miricola]MCL1658063.1 XRE family transcriptional regulator [Elizabethkingia miricola]OIK45367.1 DNA-binding protein [Elizabethkingia sp. HvH-WGS333]